MCGIMRNTLLLSSSFLLLLLLLLLFLFFLSLRSTSDNTNYSSPCLSPLYHTITFTHPHILARGHKTGSNHEG